MWERKGLLYDSQYAFRAKKGTEGPLLLRSMMNDKAYLRKEDQARGQDDRRWTEVGSKEVVRIKDLHEGPEEEVPKVETDADQRALGVQVNMHRQPPSPA